MSTIVEQFGTIVEWATPENRLNLGGTSLNTDVYYHDEGLARENGSYYPNYGPGTTPLSSLPPGTTIGGLSVAAYRDAFNTKDMDEVFVIGSGEAHRRNGFFFVVSNGKADPRHITDTDGDFEDAEMYRCAHCSAVYVDRPEGGCRTCGWEVEDRMVKMLRRRDVGPNMSTSWSGSSWATQASGYTAPMHNHSHTITTGQGSYTATEPFVGQLEIRADDGDIQIEPFRMYQGNQTMVEFTNTGQNFFVNRKHGAIVDIAIGEASSHGGNVSFRVNGRDTGLRMITAGLDPRVNNRMPTTIPIAAGTAIQMVSTR